MNIRGRLYFVILVAALVRLPNIGAPMIGAHSWRQADTAAMARNYIEIDGTFSSPRVDWGGDGSGIVESEFPLYQYTVSLIYRLVGVHEVVGRLLSLAASLATLVLFFFLALRLTDESTALWSTLVLALLPLEVFYGRAFMPEATTMMFTVLGILLFLKWAQEGSVLSLAGSAVAIATSCLMKITGLSIGVLLVFICWQRYGWKFLAKPSLWLYAGFVLGCVALWYYHAHQNYLNGGVTVGIWEYGAGKWGNWEMLVQPRFWNRLIFQSIAERHLTWFGFPLFVVGLLLARNIRREYILDAWLASVVFFFLVVARGNFVHEYYQLPFLPPAALFIGKVFARYFKRDGVPKWKPVLLSIAAVGMIVLGAARIAGYLRFENPATSAEFQLGQAIQASTLPSDLICVLDRSDPTILYLSHRKGWSVAVDNRIAQRLDSLRGRNCRAFAGVYSYVEGNDRTFLRQSLASRDSVILNGEYFIVRL